MARSEEGRQLYPAEGTPWRGVERADCHTQLEGPGGEEWSGATVIPSWGDPVVRSAMVYCLLAWNADGVKSFILTL